jgi:glutathione S-transferase
MKLKLYFSPGTCARVPLIALEEARAPFETALLKFAIGEHKSPDYLSINPKGKVPALEVDGRVLTENIAILRFLASAFPGARLLPPYKDAFEEASVVADLSWCASTIHPIVTRIVLPQLFCATAEGMVRTWEMAVEAIKPHFDLIEKRLETSPWMLGEWSIVDAFVFWIWDQVVIGGFDGEPYRRISEHATRIVLRPSVQRTMAREREALDWLERSGFGIKLPPPPKEAK